MPSKILDFRSPVTDSKRLAAEARRHCIEEHAKRMAMNHIDKIIDHARAACADQSLTKLQLLERTAKLLTVGSAQPIKKTIQPAGSVARAWFITARAVVPFITLATISL